MSVVQKINGCYRLPVLPVLDTFMLSFEEHAILLYIVKAYSGYDAPSCIMVQIWRWILISTNHLNIMRMSNKRQRHFPSRTIGINRGRIEWSYLEYTVFCAKWVKTRKEGRALFVITFHQMFFWWESNPRFRKVPFSYTCSRICHYIILFCNCVFPLYLSLSVMSPTFAIEVMYFHCPHFAFSRKIPAIRPSVIPLSWIFCMLLEKRQLELSGDYF